MPSSLRWLAIAPFLVASLGAHHARAEGALSTETAAPAAAEGTVVAIEAGDLIVDLGSARGAANGQLVELWRPVRIRHPVTGQILTDRFRIGSVRLTQVQPKLSLGKVEGELLREVAAGDAVVMRIARSPAASAEPATAPPKKPPSSNAAEASAAPAVKVVMTDPDARALADLFTSLQGAPPDARARAYEAYIAKNPQSRFVTVLREETEALRRAEAEVQPYAVSSPRLDRVRPGAPQHYAVELDARFSGAVVHVRRKGEKGFRSIPMQSVGPRYWSAVFPGDAVAEPALEYFVEGVPPTGKPVALVGTAARPREVDVDRRPIAGKEHDTLAQATIQSEYASFNAKQANDYVFQTEGAFGWRMRDVGIRAVRSGFGVLRGEGGSLRDLDELRKDPKRVGLTYGWLELELAFASRYALLVRPILGLREGGVAGGAQAFVRLGNDLATNLSLGGELLGTVGLRGIVQLDWRTIHRVPILLRTEVTNQPAGIGSDVGARAIAQVGYELAPALVVAVRASYQGRTINHAGPGAGLAASYQW